MNVSILKEKLKRFGVQMALFYLATGLFMIVLFSGVVYMVTSDIFVKEAVAKTEMAIESGAGGIGDYMRHAKSLLQISAKDVAVIDFVASGTPEAPQNILQQMTAIRESDSHIFEVFILLESGKAVGSGARMPVEGFEDVDTALPCLSSNRANSYAHVDPWTVTLGVPIISSGGDTLGTLAMDLDYCLFKHTVGNFDMGKNGNIIILSADGTLVFQADSINAPMNNKNKASLAQPQSGYNTAANTLTHSVSISGTDWTMIGTASLDGLAVLKRQIFDMVVFTGVFLFIALLAMTATVSKKLTAPLSRLAANMEDIQNLAELTVYTNEITETVTLTKSYNRMIQRIKQLMQALEEKQGELRRYELDALTSQINPHFLYNTLDTIVWLAEFRDNDKIIALTKSLATFFRLSLNGGQAVVSLRDEIEHVKQYLFIQKVRYDDKLTYFFEAEEAALECLVPKIILQPLVENAIYHGIKPMDGTGEIRLMAHVNEDELVLRICDNGVGFTPSKIGYESAKKNGGVGLRNIARRIQLYYGTQASLQIKSSPGAGASVTLHLKTALL